MNKETFWKVIDFVWLYRSCHKDAMTQDLNKFLKRLGFGCYRIGEDK